MRSDLQTPRTALAGKQPEAQTVSAGKYDVFIAPVEQFML